MGSSRPFGERRHRAFWKPKKPRYALVNVSLEIWNLEVDEAFRRGVNECVSSGASL